MFRIPGGNPPETRDSFDADGNSVALGGRYVFESSGWFLTGEFARFDLDAFGAGAEIDVLGAGVGK